MVVYNLFDIKYKNIYRFERLIGFPGVLGAVDCTLPKIIAPSDHEEAYLNYKRQHSLTLQIVCFVYTFYD